MAKLNQPRPAPFVRLPLTSQPASSLRWFRQCVESARLQPPDGRLLDEIRRLGLGLIHQWNLQSMRLWGSTQPLTDAIRSASGKQMPRSRGQSDQWSGHCRHRIPEDDEPFSSSRPTEFPRKNAVTCFVRTSCGVQFF